MGVRSSSRSGTHGSLSRMCGRKLAGAGKLAAGTTRGGREDHPLVDASVRCMQLQKLFGRAWFKMSSRSLGGPTTGPSVRVAHSSVASKRSAGKKVARRARGRKRAGSQIASALQKSKQARLRRLVAGGGSCWHPRHGTRLKSFASRRGTQRWKASRLPLRRFSSRGVGGCRLG